MIDEKKIEEVAEDIYEEYFSGNYDYTISEEDHSPLFEGANVIHAVKLGAQWAQKEFVKSLWHDASEAPKDYTDIIYVDGANDVWNEDTYYADNYDDSFCKGWQSFVSSRDVVKWCYLEDIIPKKGGEK